MVVDLFLIYKFIRKLVTPFDKWDAYDLGIIDKKGDILIKRKEFTKKDQTKAFGVFDLMVLNLKKLLAKVPGGSSKLASYSAALFLIREWNHFSNDTLLTEDVSDERIEESMYIFIKRYVDYNIVEGTVNHLFEEPAVNVGGGAVAGLGVGDDGEPGVTVTQQKKKKKLKDVLKRGIKDVK